MLHVDIVTVFPEMFRGFLGESMISRAARAGKVFIRTVDLRDFSRDQRRTVDDKPYSGGPGMLMKPDVWFDAVENCLAAYRDAGGTAESHVVMTTPAGKPYTQRTAETFSGYGHLVFLCGHYEGFDARIYPLADEAISIGDFVLTGGELPAMVITDAVSRMLPGVLGDAESAPTDSFYDGLLGFPQYTRPRDFEGMEVPEVLLSGDHAKIRQWRHEQSLRLTKEKRPDLLAKKVLSEEDRAILHRL